MCSESSGTWFTDTLCATNPTPPGFTFAVCAVTRVSITLNCFGRSRKMFFNFFNYGRGKSIWYSSMDFMVGFHLVLHRYLLNDFFNVNNVLSLETSKPSSRKLNYSSTGVRTEPSVTLRSCMALDNLL